jgi:hypothetical protein
MKTKPIFILGLILVSVSLALSSFIHKTPSASPQQRTEEYAIVDVIQTGKRKTIRVTKGTKPSIETDWGKIDTEKRDDYTPVIDVLNQLNEEGYELLNASLAYSTVGGGQTTSWGDPRHTFMMVKKLK